MSGARFKHVSKTAIGVDLMIRTVLVVLGLGALLTPSGVLANDVGCELKDLAKESKAISIFRRMEIGIDFMVLSQANAIVQVQSGVDQLLADDNTFFGPHMRLQKNTDKTQAELGAAKLDAKRARFPEETQSYFSDLESQAEIIVELGFRVGELLADGEIAAAAEVYSVETLAAWKAAKGNSYTAISNLERSISQRPLKCR